MLSREFQSTNLSVSERTASSFWLDFRVTLFVLILLLLPCQSLSIHTEIYAAVYAESDVQLQEGSRKAIPIQNEERQPSSKKQSILKQEKSLVPPETFGHAKSQLPKVFFQDKPDTVNDLRTMQNHLTGLLPKLRESTVNLRIGGAQGSGVIVSREGHILTAAHVAQEADLAVTIVLQNGRRLSGRTLGMNRDADSALVKIDGKGPWPFAPIRDPGNIRVGEWVVAMGHPGGYVEGRKPVVRLGRILSAKGDIIRTDSVLVGGDSGGPLFDMHGQVVGVHSRIGMSTSHNIHVPGSIYLEEWNRMIATETWGGMKRLLRFKAKPFLGVGADPNAINCRIATVEPNSAAEKAGILEGDVIVKFGGEQIESFRDLQIAVLKRNPGDEVKIKIIRNQIQMELKVKLKSARDRFRLKPNP